MSFLLVDSLFIVCTECGAKRQNALPGGPYELQVGDLNAMKQGSLRYKKGITEQYPHITLGLCAKCVRPHFNNLSLRI